MRCGGEIPFRNNRKMVKYVLNLKMLVLTVDSRLIVIVGEFHILHKQMSRIMDSLQILLKMFLKRTDKVTLLYTGILLN